MHKKTLTMTSYLGKVASTPATLSKKGQPQGWFPVSFTLFSDYFLRDAYGQRSLFTPCKDNLINFNVYPNYVKITLAEHLFYSLLLMACL